MNPFKVLLRNVKLSAKTCGGKNALSLEEKEQHVRKVELTYKDLEDIWYNKQKEKCFWFDIRLNPNWLLEKHNPFALSVDRLGVGNDYTKENVVISCRLANIGRGICDETKFKEMINYLKSEWEWNEFVDKKSEMSQESWLKQTKL